MRVTSICLFLISTICAGIYGAYLPSGIQPCKLSDPNLNACAKDAAQKFLPLLATGIPELGIPSFEPLSIPDIKNNDPVLNFKFENNKIYGSSDSKIEDVKIDQRKKRITLTLSNSGKLESDYTANGRLIILPVSGQGKSYIKMIGIRYVYNLYYDVVKGKDGKNYWIITKHKVNYTPKDVEFRFDNLFNGNKQLADVVIRFANENWREIFGQLGKPSMITITNSIVENISKIFAKIPIDQLFEP